MRIYYNTNGFAHHALSDVVDILADLGYDGIALTPDVHHLDPYRSDAATIDGFAAHCRRRGLGITLEAGSRFLLDARRKHHPTLLSADGFERRQDFYCRLLDVAARLGAPMVSIWSGRIEGTEFGSTQAYALLAQRLRPVLDHARQCGVTLSFEPEPGMFIETLAGFERLVAELQREDLRLTIDLGHLAVSEEAPFESHLERYRSQLELIHADDARVGVHEHLFFGEGDLDWPSLSRTLRGIAFDGVVAVELSRHSHDAVRTATRAIETLRRLGF